MLGLPKSTEFNRFIPKQKFYKDLYTKKSLPRKKIRSCPKKKNFQGRKWMYFRLIFLLF